MKPLEDARSQAAAGEVVNNNDFQKIEKYTKKPDFQTYAMIH